MNKAIYIALSGALLKHSQMEVISQNLANAASVGYKKDDISFKDYLLPADSENSQQDGRAMSQVSGIKTDFTEGNIIRTGNSLDIAIDGNGFIALEGGRYTRRGDLKRSNDGYLTTGNGIKVLGSSGPVTIPDGDIKITNTGDVLVNGIQTNTLSIVDFPSTDNLKKMGAGIFSTQDKGVKSNALVKQAYLEESNVDVIREMVSMIDAMREFGTFQKAIQAFDEATDKVNNELGRF